MEYNTISKFWCQIKVPNQDQFESRFCHSATLIEESIYIYGGMKDAENTLDNLSVLVLNGKLDRLEIGKNLL